MYNVQYFDTPTTIAQKICISACQKVTKKQFHISEKMQAFAVSNGTQAATSDSRNITVLRPYCSFCNLLLVPVPAFPTYPFR